MLSNELVTERCNEEQAEQLFQKLEFFIEESGQFFRREQEFVQRKDLKTIKPELVRINQKIVYRIDYDVIFNKIMNEEHELLHYLCQSRRHFIHLKKEHQNRLDKILFEQNWFVYLLKQSKNVRLEINSASDSASHQVSNRAKIKNLGQLNKRLNQEATQKSIKKPILFKNRVDKFLHDFAIQQQDVLDIEKLLPVLQNPTTAARSSNNASQNQNHNQSPVKMDKTAGSAYATMQPARDVRRPPLNVQINPSLSGSLAIIQEDGVESAQKFHSIEEGEERSDEVSHRGASHHGDDVPK